MIVNDEAYAMKAEGFATRPSSMAMLHRLLRELDMPKGETVLDIGCSTGIALGVMSEQGLRPSGVDVNRAAVKIAKSKGYRAYLYDGDTAPYPGEQFGAVTITTVLSHVEDPVRTLWMARDKLRPGGQIGILNPNVVHHVVSAPGRRRNGYASDPTIRQRFSRLALTELLRQIGFVDLRSGYLGRPVWKIIHPHMWIVARKPWRD